jgi:N-acetylmuramoyl-L-alanine amidase
LLLLSTALVGQQKNLSVYAPQMYYQVSIVDRGGVEYVGLVDLLEPIGRVESRAVGKKWELRFTGTGPTIEAEFQDGKRKAKIRGNDLDLSGNFGLQGDRGYVPVSSLANFLPRVLDRTADLHAASKRLFIGATAMKLVLELRHAPTHLVATFPNPVSPQIATDGSHLRIVFTRDPVVPSGTDVVSYSEAPLASSNFSEANGVAVLNVVGTAPLEAQFSDGGKTLTIAASEPQTAPSPTVAGAPLPAPAVPTPGAPDAIAAGTTAKPSRPAGRTYFIALDAGHGGDERGAQLTEALNEKDVTLALSRRIQHELEARGMSVYIVRGSDNTLTSDQRAASVNGSRAAIYVSVHAATLGTGIRIFTAMIPSAPSYGRRAFLPWETAQASFVANSSAVASAITTECKTRNLPVKSLSAPVRPLNNIATAAIAVEIAPQADTVESITDAKYQQEVASAIAAGIAASRGKLEAP